MAILLMVLKIIGIILLILLGLIFLVMILVLLVPVRYELKGSFKDKDTYDFSLRISWLLRLIQFKLQGKNKTITNRFTIFGIWLKPREKAKNKKTNIEKAESIEDDKCAEEISDNVEKVQETVWQDKISTEEQAEDYRGCEADSKISPKPKVGIFTKIKSFILGLIQKVKQTFEKIYATIKSIGDKFKAADKFLHDEKNIIVFNLVKGELFYILKHYKPRKWKGKLLLGTGDPATTGYAIGTIYALYPIHAGNLIVTPDFENKVFEGNLFIKGKMRGVHAVLTVIRLFMNKHFRSMIFKNNGGQKSGRK